MKKIKVFYGNQRLKDVFPHATRFQVLKYKTAQLLRKAFIVAVGTVATTVVFLIMKDVYITKAMEDLQKPLEVTSTLEAKIVELQSEVLDTLKACETSNITEEDGLVTFDPNPNNPKVQKASFGLYQFKQSTVIHYYKTIYKQDITGKEAIEVAMDGEKSRQLASDIIFTTKDGIDNWYNCAVKKDLYSEIKLIKKLYD